MNDNHILTSLEVLRGREVVLDAYKLSTDEPRVSTLVRTYQLNMGNKYLLILKVGYVGKVQLDTGGSPVVIDLIEPGPLKLFYSLN